MARYQKRGGKTTYGKKFRTRAGIYGAYKYINGRRVAFVKKFKRSHRSKYGSGARKSYRRRGRY